MKTHTMDLGALSADRQPAAVLEAFDALTAGDALILETRGALHGVQKALVAQRWLAFDWAPLGAAGSGRRALVLKRTVPLEPSISAYLGEDHKRLHKLLAETEAAAAKGDVERARGAFGSFEAGLRRHIVMEEEGFFPDLDRRSGMQGQGPTEVMRQEHVEIRGLLDRIGTLLADGNLDEAGSQVAALADFMEQHDEKEEQMLYPFADETFGADLEEMLKRLMLT